MKPMRIKYKIQRPTLKQKWNKQLKCYHNKGSGHFLLCVAKKTTKVAGHDLTTHPSLTKNNSPKNKYIALTNNPNLDDTRISYINKKLRKNVDLYFKDTGKRRLTVKKKWKLSKKDKSVIKRIDKNKI